MNTATTPQAEPVQLLLFDEFGNAAQPQAPQASTVSVAVLPVAKAAKPQAKTAPAKPAKAPARKAKPVKPVKPADVVRFEKMYESKPSVSALLAEMGFDGLLVDYYGNSNWRTNIKTCLVHGSQLDECRPGICLNHPLSICSNTDGHGTMVIYFSPDGEAWGSEITILGIKSLGYPQDTLFGQLDARMSPWKKIERMQCRYSLPQSATELENMLKTKNKYAFMYQKSRPELVDRPELLLMCPQIEILDKAGFKFVDTVLAMKPADVEKFNLLCRRGSNPKDIFKTSKTVYTVLKNETDMDIWDSFRKMEKFGKISEENIAEAYRHGLKKDQLDKVSGILGMQFNGKQVITFDRLMDYLAKVDMHEAIGTDEALLLIKDYVRMCIDLDIEPSFDRDSLKREHDVMARTSRQLLDPVREAGIDAAMAPAVAAMKRFDYQENIYFIRGIRSYSDLVNEAKGQSNCVASYAKPIANGETFIFVMRELAAPTKSLITVELSTDGKKIRQKSKAHNASIRNKSQSEFLERWLKHNRDIVSAASQPASA